MRVAPSFVLILGLALLGGACKKVEPPPPESAALPVAKGKLELPAAVKPMKIEQANIGVMRHGVIKNVIDARKEQIKACYTAQLAKHPQLKGRIMTHWTIDGHGRATGVKIKSSTLNSPEVETCIVGRIESWVFPEPEGGGIVEVSHPFWFEPE